MTNHKIGTQDEWQAARDELLAEEKELTASKRRACKEATGTPLGARRGGVQL